MKTPNAPARPVSRKRRIPQAPPSLPFKVFIGYADVAAARRAMATIAGAVRGARQPLEVQPMLWRFAQLESSHWRDRAISAALEADVIVLATSTPGELSATMEAWVNDFLAANRGRKATIVAVSGTSDAWTISIEHSARPAAANTAFGAAVEQPAELVA